LCIAEALPAFPQWRWIQDGVIYSSSEPVVSASETSSPEYRITRSIATSGSLPFNPGYSASCFGDSRGVTASGEGARHSDTCQSTLPLVCGISSSWRVAVDYTYVAEVVSGNVNLSGTYWDSTYSAVSPDNYYPPELTYRYFVDRFPDTTLRGHRFGYYQTVANSNLVRSDLYLVDAGQPMIEMLSETDAYLEVQSINLISGQSTYFKSRVLPLRVLGQPYTGIAGLSYYP
jgi:hypothetical protein